MPQLAFSLSLFCLISLFVLVCAWLQLLCLLYTVFFHLLCAFFVFPFVQKTCLNINQQDWTEAFRSRWSYKNDLIHYLSNSDMRVVPKHTTHTQKYTHVPLTQKTESGPEPVRSHNRTEEEEYQTRGSFFCRCLQKHGRQHTAGSLSWRARVGPHQDSRDMTEKITQRLEYEVTLSDEEWGKQFSALTWGEFSNLIYKSICTQLWKSPRELISSE